MKLKQYLIMVHNYRKKQQALKRPKWYDGWSIKVEILPENRRRVTLNLPNSEHDRTTVIECLPNSPLYDLIDITDSALTTLAEPAKREHIT